MMARTPASRKVPLWLVAVVVIAVVVIGMGGWLWQRSTDTAQDAPQSAEVTADGVVSADHVTIDNPECAVGDLDVQIDAPSSTVGSDQLINVSMGTRAQTACVAAAGHLTFTVTSGTDVLIDTSQCADRDQDATPLLLMPGRDPWKGTLTWDGRRYSGCAMVDTDSDQQADIVDAGTFTIRVFYDGQHVGNDVVATRTW